MKITLSSIIVTDQAQALAFYRDILGFVVKEDVDMGGPRWITLASPEAPDGARISLEPAGYPFARTYQDALKSNGIPLTAFAVADLNAEYEQLVRLGVVFRDPPREGDATTPSMATFDDTCGNWIMLYEEPKA